jgi:hypothetical protein
MMGGDQRFHLLAGERPGLGPGILRILGTMAGAGLALLLSTCLAGDCAEPGAVYRQCGRRVRSAGQRVRLRVIAWRNHHSPTAPTIGGS